MDLERKNWRGLVVDDVTSNSQATGMALSSMGGQITVANNGAEAVEILRLADQRGLAFDIVFTDVQMPVMGGIEAARMMRFLGFEGPIVAISGSDEQNLADRCLAAGCDEFIAKPATFDGLSRVVMRFFRPNCQSAAPAKA
jgi:CheY-like chemotaxis protein